MKILHLSALGAAMALFALTPAPVAGQSSPETLLENSLYLSMGWAFGISSQAFSFAPSTSPPAARESDSDAEPLINLTGVAGNGSSLALETKAVLGNFGRLVELSGLQSGGTSQSADSAGTSVRRALITDVTLRVSPAFVRGSRAGIQLLFNTGFIFDAGGSSGLDAVNDAASYWFFGLSWNAHFDPEGLMVADILLGRSEVLTGIEPYSDGGPLRLRPRLTFGVPGVGGAERLDIGFWADLGLEEDRPDAVTVFMAVPLSLGGGSSGDSG